VDKWRFFFLAVSLDYFPVKRQSPTDRACPFTVGVLADPNLHGNQRTVYNRPRHIDIVNTSSL